MRILAAPRFDQSYVELVAQDTILKKKIEHTLAQFLENPRHPSLRVHKLQGNLSTIWSMSVTMRIRIIFTYIPNGVMLIDIGTHKVYKR